MIASIAAHSESSCNRIIAICRKHFEAVEKVIAPLRERLRQEFLIVIVQSAVLRQFRFRRDNGIRYVVVALPEDEAWLTNILKTWQFAGSGR